MAVETLPPPPPEVLSAHMSSGGFSRQRNLLAISNNTESDKGHDLDHVGNEVEARLAGRHDIVIISWANDNMDGAAERVHDAITRYGALSSVLLHQRSIDEIPQIIKDAQAIFVTGGNTFRLPTNIHADKHADGEFVDARSGANRVSVAGLLWQHVLEGKPFLGVSAGAMIQVEDFRTCADIIPLSARRKLRDGSVNHRTDGLNFFRSNVSIHPHFEDSELDNMDEAEAKHLQEYADDDTGHTIVALRNGVAIDVRGDEAEIRGVTSAVLFRAKQEREEIQPNTNVSFLLGK